MVNHQKAFVSVKVLLIAPQLTLPRVRDGVEPDAGETALELHCLRLEVPVCFHPAFQQHSYVQNRWGVISVDESDQTALLGYTNKR